MFNKLSQLCSAMDSLTYLRHSSLDSNNCFALSHPTILSMQIQLLQSPIPWSITGKPRLVNYIANILQNLPLDRLVYTSIAQRVGYTIVSSGFSAPTSYVYFPH